MNPIRMFQSAFEALFPGLPGVPPGFHLAEFPDEVSTWFEDLLLLRGLPLSYLLPDPRLLPPESIRMFHVDPTWTARLFDGALAAASFGSFDAAIHAPIVRILHQRAEWNLACRLFPEEKPETVKLPQLSGLLLRSELVRRWPGLGVSGWEDTGKKRPLALARKDRLAPGLMIVLFAGVPARVEISEPGEGTRFGVELMTNNSLTIQVRNQDGSFRTTANNQPAPPVTVQLRDASTGVLDIDALATATGQALGTSPLAGAHLSLCLQQQPFVQVFQGSGPQESTRIRRLRKGRRGASKTAAGG